MNRVVLAILGHEARRLLRDRFLLGMAVYILGIALALRWILPWMQGALLTRADFDLGPYLPLATSYFVVVNTSVLTGLVSGFLLLELKEEGILRALAVTPVSIGAHLAVLGGAIFGVGTLVAVGLGLVIGVGVPDLAALAASAAVGAPSGLVIALVIAVLSANKVEAFAVLKFVSLFGLVPVGGYFLPEGWRALAGVVPLYWASDLWWSGPSLVSAAAGLAVTAAWLAVLAPRMVRA